MKLLLTADLHLTDNPQDAYRWDVFSKISEIVDQHHIQMVCILGDMFDRKDRHSATLVNCLVEQLLMLLKLNVEIIILSGNHDAPLTGIYFWEFLNRYSGITYVTKITKKHGILLLPFSPNPERDWRSIDFSDVTTIFMHQPIQGAVANNGKVLEKAPPLPPLPNVPIYSGDIHHQQVIQNVTYIGTPHPVHFDESWVNRVLLLDLSDPGTPQELPIQGTRRAILDISSSAVLDATPYRNGDQVRIRYHLDGANLTSWPQEQDAIIKWAMSRFVHVASLEAVIIGDSLPQAGLPHAELELMQPEQVLQTFCKSEKLSKDILEAGLQLVKESRA